MENRDQVGTTEMDRRRRERLLAELSDEGVELFRSDSEGNIRLRDQQFNAEHVTGIIVDELAYARHSPVHEQRRSTYGSLVLADPAWIDQLAKFVSDHRGSFINLVGKEPTVRDIANVRAFANGRTTFLVRSPRGPESLLELDSADEYTLALLAREHVFAVQRTPAGAVKVFTKQELWLFEFDRWWVKPYAYSSLAGLRRLFPAADGASQASAPPDLGELLQFCLHVLSTRHIGATLAWFPRLKDPLAVAKNSLADRGHQPAVSQIDFSHHREAISTFLSSIDGACLVGKDGQLTRAGVKLSFAKKTGKFIQQDRGTRHTSAKRFSYEMPESLVFVVSQDGPVTVYSDGMSVLHLPNRGVVERFMDILSNIALAIPMFAGLLPPSGASRTASSSRPTSRSIDIVSCPNCKKQFQIYKTWKKTSATGLDCPVCGSPKIAAVQGTSLYAIPLKPWAH